MGKFGIGIYKCRKYRKKSHVENHYYFSENLVEEII